MRVFNLCLSRFKSIRIKTINQHQIYVRDFCAHMLIKFYSCLGGWARINAYDIPAYAQKMSFEKELIGWSGILNYYACACT